MEKSVSSYCVKLEATFRGKHLNPLRTFRSFLLTMIEIRRKMAQPHLLSVWYIEEWTLSLLTFAIQGKVRGKGALITGHEGP